MAMPAGRVPADASEWPDETSVADTEKYPASEDEQLSATVCGPALTEKRALARATPQSSSTCHATVSAWDARVVKAKLNLLPSAKVRVPSLPGVSASMAAPVPLALAGAEGCPHVSTCPPAATIGVIEADCPDEVALCVFALLAAAAPLPGMLLAGLVMGAGVLGNSRRRRAD